MKNGWMVHVVALGGLAWLAACGAGPQQQELASAGEMPVFEVDPAWPQPLPNNWIIGQVAGLDIDSDGHVWIVHRPNSLSALERGAEQNPPLSRCCVAAPSVIEFDEEGSLLQAWGGPGEGYHWPASEHGLFIDGDDNVWIGSNGPDDHVVYKFSPDGELLLTLGVAGETGGSNDTERLGGPADITVDPDAREVYIADGYVNRRVIVFDSETGEYKRHWGAYGATPDDDVDPGDYDPDAEAAEQFRGPVHAVRLSSDGLVYVSDRRSNRIQVFRPDGEFVEETIIAPATRSMGSTWDLAFSPDPEQNFVYVPDGTNKRVWILERDGLEVVSSFGGGGRNAGHFDWVHNLAVDADGSIYTTEVNTGKRVQKFRMTGFTAAQSAQ